MTPRRSWRSDRRGAVAVITAVVMVVMLGLVGLAIDMGVLYQIDSTVSLAANSAAMNALKIAATAEEAGDLNYLAEGIAAGNAWFDAALGAHAAAFDTTRPHAATVALTGSTTISAKVKYSGWIESIFGRLFNVLSYPIDIEVDASISTTPYLEILFMLDNSSSMDIGATNADIAKLSTLSPCDPSNANYGTSTVASTWTNASADNYSDYSCSNGGQYDGATPCPVAAGAPLTFATFTPDTGERVPVSTGQTCKGLLPAQSNGMVPLPGPPCAFACHWTNKASTDPRGGTADLFGMARRNGVTLRFDLLKNATNGVLRQMQSDNLSFNNLSVGIYAFNTAVTEVYPAGCSPHAFGCEAGSDFTAAQALVGTPPTLPAIADTGISPVVGLLNIGPTNDDTAFPEAMNTLAGTYVTPAGNGTTAASPRKVLFLVTDGFEDDPNTGARQAFDPSRCAQFKDLGYTVFVVYTPYYPLMHVAYLSSWIPIVEGSGPASLAYNLQACSSGPGDYVSATDQASLSAALLNFLKQAETSVITFTR